MQDLNIIKSFLENMEFSNQKKFVRLIIQHSIPFTENKNGIFVNINEISDIHLNIIHQFKSLILEEELKFNQIELTKSNLKQLLNSTTHSSESCTVCIDR